MSRDAALIVVDVQKGLDDPKLGRRSNPDAEANIARMLSAWRVSNRPVFHIRHLSTNEDSPLRPESEGCEIKDEAAPIPGEAVIEKSVNSAFIGTDLEERLREAGSRSVYICGLTTNHCVETTARMAGNLGFETFLVSDACATFDRTGPDGKVHEAEEVHAMTLANLHEEFATITGTESAVEEIESRVGSR